MRELAELPFFASIPAAALNVLRERIEIRSYGAGTVILRRGDPGTAILVLAAGAARVELDPTATGRTRRTILGPGHILGEMAVLSGLPISATVIAMNDCVAYRLPRDVFLECLEAYPQLYRTVTETLIDRLRHRTGPKAEALQPALALLAIDVGNEEAERLSSAVVAGVCFYAPGSIYVDAVRDKDELRRLPELVQQWRNTGGGEQYLLLMIDKGDIVRIRDLLAAGDVVLQVGSGLAQFAHVDPIESGVADFQRVRIGPRKRLRDPAATWEFAIDSAEIASWTRGGGRWTRTDYPNLDRLSRYVAAREVGIVMSVGAAAGFAHFGVLASLEDAGLPLDYLCGSSMGGVVALAYAKFENARRAGEVATAYGGANSKIRDAAWVPRSSIFNGQKSARVFKEVFGDDTLADLTRPVTVVATDLVAGEQILIDSGYAAQAALATSAIPGLFPPVVDGSRMLVDGGVVARVPVDLLLRRRCGCRIAVRITAGGPRSIAEREIDAKRLRTAVARPLGLRDVIAGSWKLLGWWDSASQAQRADMVISVETPPHESFNFDSASKMIDIGWRHTETQADAIRGITEKLLTPGTP